MNLYLVLDEHGPKLAQGPAREVWVAVERDDRFYVYDSHTERFHLNAALWRDFYGDMELTFRPIDAATARERIAAGVGAYDGRAVADLLADHRADPAPLDPAEVLGQEAPGAVPSARQRSKALAAVLARSPGQWVTWERYPTTKAAAARVAASQLRTRKIAAVQALGAPVEAETVTSGQEIFVRARLVDEPTSSAPRATPPQLQQRKASRKGRAGGTQLDAGTSRRTMH